MAGSAVGLGTGPPEGSSLPCVPSPLGVPSLLWGWSLGVVEGSVAVGWGEDSPVEVVGLGVGVEVSVGVGLLEGTGVREAPGRSQRSCGLTNGGPGSSVAVGDGVAVGPARVGEGRDGTVPGPERDP